MSKKTQIDDMHRVQLLTLTNVMADTLQRHVMLDSEDYDVASLKKPNKHIRKAIMHLEKAYQLLGASLGEDS